MNGTKYVQRDAEGDERVCWIMYLSPRGRIPHAFTKAAYECLERHQEPSQRPGRIFVGRLICLSPGPIVGPGVNIAFNIDFASTFPPLAQRTLVGCDCCRFRGSYGRWRPRTACGGRYARAGINLLFMMDMSDSFLTYPGPGQCILCSFHVVRS